MVVVVGEALTLQEHRAAGQAVTAALVALQAQREMQGL
jgi:hypothetical protein